MFKPKDQKISQPLPRPSEILAEIRVSPSPANQAEAEYKERFSEEGGDAEEKYTHLQGLREHYRHKTIWSSFIMGLMGVMILFQSYLLLKVGVGDWDFSKYEWLLPALLVQNLAQVVGLAVFVVKALFKDLKG